MKVGQKRMETGGFKKRIRPTQLGIGESMTVRIVIGPERRYYQMWPTQVEDEGTGVMKNTWRSVSVSKDQETLLDKLGKLDRFLKEKEHKKRKNAGATGKERKIRSMLDKQRRDLYAVIPRTVPGSILEPNWNKEVYIMEANWTIANRLSEISNLEDPNNKSVLLNGLIYMYDVMISVSRNAATGERSYSVEPYNCQVHSTVPIKYLDENCPIEDPLSYFPAEDIELINATTWELEDEDKPKTQEEIVKMLEQFPIDIRRQDKKNPNIYILFDSEENCKQLESFATNNGIPLLTNTVIQNSSVGLPQPEHQRIEQPASTQPGPAMPPQGNINIEKVDVTRPEATTSTSSTTQPEPQQQPQPQPQKDPGLKEPEDVW